MHFKRYVQCHYSIVTVLYHERVKNYSLPAAKFKPVSNFDLKIDGLEAKSDHLADSDSSSYDAKGLKSTTLETIRITKPELVLGLWQRFLTVLIYWRNFRAVVWLSWYSGCFRYQRSVVQIKSSAKIYINIEHLFTVNCVLKRRK